MHTVMTTNTIKGCLMQAKDFSEQEVTVRLTGEEAATIKKLGCNYDGEINNDTYGKKTL